MIKHKKDGTLINVYEVARTIQIDESEDYLLLVVCTDITDKKQNETLLKESSELNRKLLEQMPVPVAILHKENISFILPCVHSSIIIYLLLLLTRKIILLD